MSVTLTFGWWLLPLVITVLAISFALFLSQRKGGQDDLAGGIVSLIFFCFATIISLLAWLIWAVLA